MKTAIEILRRRRRQTPTVPSYRLEAPEPDPESDDVFALFQGKCEEGRCGGHGGSFFA